MKTLIAFMSLCVSMVSFVQAQEKPETQLINFGFGFTLGLESLEKTVAEEVGLSATGLTVIDFHGRMTALKYVMIDLGLSVSHFKDKLPFEQAVVFTSGQLSGLPSTATSKITSGSFYYSIGGKLPVMDRLSINASLGQRRFSASRGIPECQDCNKTDIDLQAGNYVQGGLSWRTVDKGGGEVGELDLLYTHYFEKAFLRTISIGFIVYL